MSSEYIQTGNNLAWQEINESEKEELRKHFEVVRDDHVKDNKIEDGRAGDVETDDRLLLPVVFGMDRITGSLIFVDIEGTVGCYGGHDDTQRFLATGFKFDEAHSLLRQKGQTLLDSVP